MTSFLCVPGGPLCEGDIEEADGALKVFCPWHDYGFDLRTGESGSSLQVGSELWCFFFVLFVFVFSDLFVSVVVVTNTA